jgi:hypothetical protein
VVVDVSKLTSLPYIVYVPITVKGEGRFDFKGTLHVEALEGETILGFDSIDRSLRIGIFAFDGEVFFSGDSRSALEAAAANSLNKKANSEYNKLLNKKENINKGILRQTFSKDEEEKLKKLHDDAVENVYKLYFDRYPIK